MHTILYRNSRFKQTIFSKYASNLKTRISQRNLFFVKVNEAIKCENDAKFCERKEFAKTISAEAS